MLLLLTLILAFCSIFFIKISNGDVLCPLALSWESYFLCSFIATLGSFLYDINITINTVMVVFFSLLVFSVGYFLVAIPKVRIKQNRANTEKTSELINVSYIILVIVLVVEVMSVFTSINSMKTIVAGSNFRAPFLMIVRNHYLFMGTSQSVISIILNFFTIGVGYFFSYVIINNLLIKQNTGRIKTILEALIVVVSLCVSVFGTGRTFLVKWMTVCVVFSFYLYMHNNQIKIINTNKFFSIVKKLLLILVLFFLCFQGLGLLTGKTGTTDAFSMLYGYSGASIPALDIAIRYYIPDDRFFGEESFYGLYGFLNNLGCNIPNDILHLPFVQFDNGMRTNIYSSLRSYLYDFGWMGLYITQFLLGIISGILYKLLKKNYQNNALFILLYGLFIYGIVMQGVAETVLRNFMSITNIGVVVSFAFVYYIVVCKKISIKYGGKEI